jgi:Ser/Thr protein kinase RdoA (MazF antagonist)
MSDRGWAAVLPASALVALIFVIADIHSPLRPVVILWFLFICPGMAVVRLLALQDSPSELMLAVVISVTLTTGTALAMVYTALWSPRLGVILLAAFTLAATYLPLVARLPVIETPLRDGHWRRVPFDHIAARIWLRVLLGAQTLLVAVGLAPAVRRVLWWLTGRGRRARAVRKIMPHVRAAISEQSDLPSPTDWTTLRALPTISDRMVFLMGPRHQPPVAVAKLERHDHAQSILEGETANLLALQADARIGDWRRLLPQVLAVGEADEMVYRVERMLPGVPGTSVLASKGTLPRLRAAAATAIAELHQRTASTIPIDAARLEPWIDDPTDTLLELSESRPTWAGYRLAIERMRTELREKLLGRSLALSWVHGDYWPANVLVTDDAGTVTGIVDWDFAEAEGLPHLDLMHLFVSMRMIEQRQEFGVVVRSLLNEADWTCQESDLLKATWAALPGDRVGTRELLLLAWLRHVDTMRTQARLFSGPLLWESQNIEQVLEVL